MTFNTPYADWMPTTSEVAGQQFHDARMASGPIPIKAKKRKSSSISSDEIFTSSQYFFGRDTSNPPELNDLFKPLFCELCGTHLNSVKSAQIHYESKAHDKHITSWIAHNFTEKGLVPPKVKRFVNQSILSVAPFHCVICDLPLTSSAHAKQHYEGKRHKLVLKKHSKPSGAGYYNEEGNWVRTGTKVYPEILNDTRFGIGEAFKVEISSTNVSLADSTTAAKKVPMIHNNSTTCSICNITVTSPPQMTMHSRGAKHLKKLRDLGLPSTNTDGDTIMANLYKEAEPTDLSIYRTPSGCYYCKICNINVTDESSLKAHLLGKKHTKIAASTADAESSKTIKKL